MSCRQPRVTVPWGRLSSCPATPGNGRGDKEKEQEGRDKRGVEDSAVSRALAQLQPLKVNHFQAECLHPTFTMVHYSTEQCLPFSSVPWGAFPDPPRKIQGLEGRNTAKEKEKYPQPSMMREVQRETINSAESFT